MQINNSINNRYVVPYKSDTKGKNVFGFSVHKDERKQGKKSDFAATVDKQEFHRAWMPQGSVAAFGDMPNKGTEKFGIASDKNDWIHSGVKMIELEDSVGNAGDRNIMYTTYKSEHYKVVPDCEAQCLDIYNNQGEHLGAFSYSDLKIRQDAATGKEFLISEHGTMCYDALVLDAELKEDLQNLMGKEKLDMETLRGYQVKEHSGTGIQYLLKDGEEGHGGKVLLQSESDIKNYEALAETYYNKYPNLIKDKNAAYIWADLEIKGMAAHTEKGIIFMGFDSMSYHDNTNGKNNWCVMYSEDTYKKVCESIVQNRQIKGDIEKFSTWMKIFDSIDSNYERIWSKEEEKYGYLNH